jgi:DDE superfamily endonuclease
MRSPPATVGAARQYSGTVGDIALCQVAATLTYATGRGHALVGRAYLPEGCAADEEHRELASVPEEVLFATKPQLAGALLDRAQSLGIRAAFVAGDEVYGGRELRRGIRQRGMRGQLRSWDDPSPPTLRQMRMRPPGMPGLPGGIARAVAGHAGRHGAGGEEDKQAPRIAQISWGRLEVEDSGAGKDVSGAVDRIGQHSSAHGPGPAQVTGDDQAEDAQGKVASNPCLLFSHCRNYCPDQACMERIVSAGQPGQASSHGVSRCGFRARSALERWRAKFRHVRPSQVKQPCSGRGSGGR